ncbi:hypothetical protein [Saccharothrix hoggarensis]|uniref:Uncharacterized protein n=1 Tax=Saccharothrix hoggarensis TaxID=913853 RepID=A0ABW3R3T2_9PSEU
MVERVSRWRSPRWSLGATAVAVLLTAWAGSPPGGYYGVALVAFLAWAVAAVLWLTALGAAMVALPAPFLAHVRRLWPFLVVPALAVATGTALETGLARRVAFEAHRSALSALVAEAAATPDPRIVDRRVGLHLVRSTRVDPATGCTLMTVEDAGFLDSRGYAHCPNGAPPNVVEADVVTYQPIDGPWYEFSLVW